MEVERYPSPEDVNRLVDDILDALLNGGDVSFAIDHTGKLFLCDGSYDMLLGTIRGKPGTDSRLAILRYIMNKLTSNVVESAPY